jgi:hypothetical protein
MSTPLPINRVIKPALSHALISLAQAKDLCGIKANDASRDQEVGQLVAQLSLAAEHYCDRFFVVQEYRDQIRYACFGLSEPVRTRQFPIQTDNAGEALLTVTIDGGLIDPSEYDLDLDNGRIYPIGGWGGASIVIDYTAGFDPIPADVQAAVSHWVGGSWGSRGRDSSIRSETIYEVMTVVYADQQSSAAGGMEGPPDSVCGLLLPYRLMYA